MGKQRPQRSWIRLLITSVIAGAGVAALRSLLRPAVPPAASPSFSEAVQPGLPASPRGTEAPVPAPAVALTKTSGISQRVPMSEPEIEMPPASEPVPEPVWEPVLEPAPVPVPQAAPENPQLAFVAEPTAPMYLPPTNEGSRWDPPTGPEWLPGFAPGGALAHDPWTSTGTLPAGPAVAPPAESDGLTGRVRGGFQEWRYQTPRRQMVFTILGIVCLIAAIVATVVVLTL